MKKLICSALLVLVAAGASYGESALGTNPPKGFTPSNNVLWAYESAAVSGTSTKDVFSIATKHTAGDKIYGTTNASGTIYFSESTPSTTLPANSAPTLPQTSTDSTVVGGADNWTAM